MHIDSEKCVVMDFVNKQEYLACKRWNFEYEQCVEMFKWQLTRSNLVQSENIAIYVWNHLKLIACSLMLSCCENCNSLKFKEYLQIQISFNLILENKKFTTKIIVSKFLKKKNSIFNLKNSKKETNNLKNSKMYFISIPIVILRHNSINICN